MINKPNEWEQSIIDNAVEYSIMMWRPLDKSTKTIVKTYAEAKKLYKSFSELNEYYINDIKGNVKYLPDYSGKSILKSNCRTILNVKFGSGLKNEIKLINKGKALEKILPDAWISRDIKDAEAFIAWLKSSMFYDLTYNDNNEALKMINETL